MFLDMAFVSGLQSMIGNPSHSLAAPDGLELVYFRLLCLMFCCEINEKNTFLDA
jgi:hypothetical protein